MHEKVWRIDARNCRSKRLEIVPDTSSTDEARRMKCFPCLFGGRRCDKK